MRNARTKLSHALLLSLALLSPACDLFEGGSGSMGGATTPPASTVELGDIAAEVAYYQTGGHGAIQVVLDPFSPDVGIAHLDPFTGAPTITMNPMILAGLPVLVGDHFWVHEYGHHYLEHVGKTPNKTAEHYADAFCVRVMLELAGTSSGVQEVIAWYASTGSPGDATHASHADRAAYMQDVLDAFYVDKTSVPAPPTGTGTGGGTGTLVIGNPFEQANIYVNYQYIGWLPTAATDSLVVGPGYYQVDWQSQFTGFLLHSTTVYVGTGQTVFVP